MVARRPLSRAAVDNTPLASKPVPRACTFCEHTYIYPCDGKSDTCMNKKWRQERLSTESARSGRIRRRRVVA